MQTENVGWGASNDFIGHRLLMKNAQSKIWPTNKKYSYFLVSNRSHSLTEMAFQNNVDLGFAEPCKENWRLFSQYFPSKLGGSPAWLSLTSLPDYEVLRCAGCSKSCKFLLQLYSPGDEDEDASCADSQTFHRAIFLFVCAENSCRARSFMCFRSQLPRRNVFYDVDPPNYDHFDKTASNLTASKHGKVCHVCYCAATKSCSQCKSYSYCSKDHQTFHWKNGHKEECSCGDTSRLLR